MKKFLLPSLFAIGFFANAQVDVTASGGTTTATYLTLKGAFDAINLGTHQGNIKLSITASTTETASAILNANGGVANYTSILIKPTVVATISGSVNAAALVNLNGATNVTIDGSTTEGGTTKDLTFSNTNTNGTSSALRFINGASNNILKNNILKGVSIGTANGVVVFSTSTATAGNNNNTLSNNDITKGATVPVILVYNSGTAAKANTNNVVSGNKIFDFSAYGVYDAGNSNALNILNNDIYLSASVASATLTGIRPNTSTIASSVYNGNKIHDLVTTTATGTVTGINLFGISSSSSILVANNMIYNLSGPASGSGSVIGIFDQLDSGSTANIFFNTVLISGSVTGTTASYAYYRGYQNPTVLKNNIFANTRTSSADYIQAAFRNTNSTGTFTSDYNVLYNSGGPANISAMDLVGTTPTQYATFSAYQAAAAASGRDVNSKGVEPFFVSATDLHLIPTDVRNANLSNWGTSIASVTTDIDGDTRTSTPDVGADEWTYIAPTTKPNCATVSYPTNNATAVPLNSTVTWSSVTDAEKYKIYIATTPGGTDVVNGTEVSGTSYNLNLAFNQTYYLIVIPTNAVGDATGCTEIKFTTTYCAPKTSAPTATAPILSVNFATTTYTSDNGVTNIGTYTPYQDFSSKEFIVKSDVTSVPLTVNGVATGTTNGWGMAAYIDWNNDGDFDDANEQYFNTAETMLRVVGGTPVAVAGNITIPTGVSFGKKRMRVKYNYTNATLNLVFVTACEELTNGQAEDYTIDYQDVSLAVSDINKTGISVYPNPFTDILKISDLKEVKSISINDMSGRQVKSLAPSAEINLSSLNAGLYIVNLQMEDGSIKTFKAIKK